MYFGSEMIAIDDILVICTLAIYMRNFAYLCIMVWIYMDAHEYICIFQNLNILCIFWLTNFLVWFFSVPVEFWFLGLIGSITGLILITLDLAFDEPGPKDILLSRALFGAARWHHRQPPLFVQTLDALTQDPFGSALGRIPSTAYRDRPPYTAI
jgi:hypothetical protein